ncbi:MAG: lysoplasmalogenase family protein [Candidatus Limnocylindrales bacterium]
MTPLLTAGIVAVAVAAIVNWYAVARGFPRLERPAKLAVPAILIAVTLLSGPVASPGIVLLVAALGASLAGDWLLLPPERFTGGLAAFLLAHLAYLAVFLLDPVDLGLAILGTVGAVLVVAAIGRRIIAGAAMRGLRAPVAAYLGVISLMAIAATASGSAVAALGAWLFVASDARLGWSRFVTRVRPSAGIDRLWVMVPYHLAQVLLTMAILVGQAS